MRGPSRAPPGSNRPRARSTPALCVRLPRPRPRQARDGAQVARRSVRTTIIRASPASASSSSLGVDGIRHAEAEQLAAASAGSRPLGVPSSASNSVLGQGLGLREEVEDAPAGVVDHQQAQVRQLPGCRQAAEVVEEGEVAEHGPGPAPLPAASPAEVETRPSMPLAPRLEANRTPSGPGRRKASRSRTGMLEAASTESPSRSASAQRGPESRLAELVQSVESGRRRPRGRPARHRARRSANGEPATARGAGAQAREPVGQRAGGSGIRAQTIVSARRVGSRQSPPGRSRSARGRRSRRATGEAACWSA